MLCTGAGLPLLHERRGARLLVAAPRSRRACPALPCTLPARLALLTCVQMGALEGLVGRIDDKTAVLTINADGVIQIVNKATCSMLGCARNAASPSCMQVAILHACRRARCCCKQH